MEGAVNLTRPREAENQQAGVWHAAPLPNIKKQCVTSAPGEAGNEEEENSQC